MTARKAKNETNGTVDFSQFKDACLKNRVLIPYSNWAIIPEVTNDSITLKFHNDAGMNCVTTIPRTGNETMQTSLSGSIVYASDGQGVKHPLQFLANVKVNA